MSMAEASHKKVVKDPMSFIGIAIVLKESCQVYQNLVSNNLSNIK
jgi:hypothetical protein